MAGERFGIYYLQLAIHDLQFVIIWPACYQEVARNRGPVDDIPGGRRLKIGSLGAWETPESELESEREGKDAAPCLHFDSLPPATADQLWGVQLCGGYAGGSWYWSKHQIFVRTIPWQFYTCSGHFNMKNIVSRQCSSWRKAWSTSSLTTLPSCRASWLGSRSKTYVLIHNLANHTSETAIIEAVFLSHACDEGRERTKRCRAQSFQYSCMFCMSRF